MNKSIIEKHYNDLFSKYFRPSTAEKFRTIDLNFVGVAEKMKEKIKEVLDSGKKIKCGYMATSIRGYHHRYIFIKD